MSRGPNYDDAADAPKCLRDEFAMAALSGLVATQFGREAELEIIATEAYLLADAMMEVRK